MPQNDVQITEYPSRYLDCRIINHPWEEHANGPWIELGDGGVQVIYEKFICRRCGNVRIDQRTESGMLLRRNYRHQVNFLLPEGLRSHALLAQERTQRVLASMPQSVSA